MIDNEIDKDIKTQLCLRVIYGETSSIERYVNHVRSYRVQSSRLTITQHPRPGDTRDTIVNIENVKELELITRVTETRQYAHGVRE